MNTLKQLQKALYAIEAGLTEELSIEMLSRIAGMTVWHFQQSFYAAVGEPVADYLQKRRLAQVAQKMSGSSSSLEEIAKAYRFGSHDELSRAFKTHWKIDPTRTRRAARQLDVSLMPTEISAESLRQRFNSPNIDPDIIELPERYYVGMQGTFIGALSPRANHLEVIPALWAAFEPRVAEVFGDSVSVLYGLSNMPTPGRQAEFDVDQLLYLASCEVFRGFDVPEGLHCWKTMAGHYAKFTFKGFMNEIGAFMQVVYGYWLPLSNLRRAPGPEIEVYDGRFDPLSPDNEVDILIPVEK